MTACSLGMACETSIKEMRVSKKEYLKPAWYVAAWSNEVGREHLLERTIIERSLVLYRREDGTPVAIGNACAHRCAPLSMGRLVGDAVQCPYHGLQFGPSGQCVHNPHGDGRIPAKMMVPSYPAVERHKAIWVWMGNPAEADPATIPDFSCHEDTELAFVGGMLEVHANYQLIVDNLMDLSHAATVHKACCRCRGCTPARSRRYSGVRPCMRIAGCPTGRSSLRTR
jgi:phenylpropionate dioxygenase-like ring-hydroxylating dioxygenase large terminal subunit